MSRDDSAATRRTSFRNGGDGKRRSLSTLALDDHNESPSSSLLRSMIVVSADDGRVDRRHRRRRPDSRRPLVRTLDAEEESATAKKKEEDEPSTAVPNDRGVASDDEGAFPPLMTARSTRRLTRRDAAVDESDAPSSRVVEVVADDAATSRTTIGRDAETIAATPSLASALSALFASLDRVGRRRRRRRRRRRETQDDHEDDHDEDDDRRGRLLERFCASFLPDDDDVAFAFAWDAIANGPSGRDDDDDDAPEALLADHLARRRPAASLDRLRALVVDGSYATTSASDDAAVVRRRRARASAATRCATRWTTRRSRDDRALPPPRVLLSVLAGPLHDHLVAPAPTRTNLAASASDAIVAATRATAEDVLSGNDDVAAAVRAFDAHLPSLVRHLETRVAWASSGGGGGDARRRCAAAAVEDLRTAFAETARERERSRVAGEDADEARDALVRRASRRVLGVGVPTTDDDDGVVVRIGGLVQCLGTTTSRRSGLDAPTLLRALLRASTWSPRDDDDAEVAEEFRRDVVRTLASFLADKKALSGKDDEARDDEPWSWRNQITAHTLNLLRSRSERCVTMAIECLNRLWCDADGVPRDLVATERGDGDDEPPPALTFLMDGLSQRSTETGSDDDDGPDCDPCERALCALVARVARFDPRRLLTHVLTRVGGTRSRHGTEIVRALAASLTDDDAYLRERVGTLLLDDLSNARLHARCADVLPSLDPAFVVPRLTGRFVDPDRDEASSRVAADTVGRVLLRTPDVAAVANLLMDRFDDDDDDSSALALARCVRFAGSWRRSLLSSSAGGGGPDRYAALTTAVGARMFRDPSRAAPLTWLGALVDGDADAEEDPARSARIARAARSLLCLATKELERLDRTESSSSSSFARLSPLLLLRRVPGRYWAIAREDDTDADAPPYASLARALVARLDAETERAPEERRLAAEVAGRCLPFCRGSSSSSITTTTTTCFDAVCAPAFSAALVRPEDETALRAARAALYAACHHLPFARDDDADDAAGLTTVAVFCVETLRAEEPPYDDDDDENGSVRLRTGCVDFLALCLDSWTERNVRRRARSEDLRRRTANAHLVRELPSSDGAPHERPTPPPRSGTFAVLSRLFSLLLSVATTAEAPAWYETTRVDSVNRLSSDLPSRGAGSFSVAARTCAINALVLATQRVSSEDGRSRALAAAVAPRLLDAFADDDDDRHPPLCVAAALQVVVVCVARSASLTVLTPRATADAVDAAARRAHRWAVRATRTADGGHARDAARLAGLKLLSAIVALDRPTNDDDDDDPTRRGSLRPEEMRETASVLRGAAHVDSDPRIRRLATRVLQTMSA